MEQLTPVYTAALFPSLHAELVGLLRGLDADDWERPTLAAPWRVRDVVAHLLDGDLRKLSGGRDGHQLSERPVSSFSDIVGLVNELNAGGVGYARRLSHRVMTDVLEITGRWVSEYVAALSPHDTASLAVAWAGENRSENWMDTGREYTERWHHQMQIRDAVGADGLYQQSLFHPLLDLSVRAFRRSYGEVAAPAGTAVVLEVTAMADATDVPADNVWSIVREAQGWNVLRGRPPRAAACIRMDADTAWRLLYNALPSEAVRARATISGEASLIEPLLRTRSVMV